ncbi:MAG TPA: hypothetical protein VFG35_06770, partial [Actinoplanes sp.]|nr:hypothetical protein [Actinoplanes sp.]
MSIFNGKGPEITTATAEELRNDAAEKIAVLQAMRAEFINESNNEPLTSDQMRLASRTNLLAFEKGLVIAE